MKKRATIEQYLMAAREFQYLKVTNQPAKASMLCNKYGLNHSFTTFLNAITSETKVSEQSINQWKNEYLQVKRGNSADPKDNELVSILRDIYDELVSIRKELR